MYEVGEQMQRMRLGRERPNADVVEPEFDKPALIAWSADDVFFALENGQRLAATIPRARFEVIEGARTFSMVDSPDRLADQLSTVAVRT